MPCGGSDGSSWWRPGAAAAATRPAAAATSTDAVAAASAATPTASSWLLLLLLLAAAARRGLLTDLEMRKNGRLFLYTASQNIWRRHAQDVVPGRVTFYSLSKQIHSLSELVSVYFYLLEVKKQF